MRTTAMFFAATIVFNTPAQACESIWEQDTPMLPGESSEQYQQRQNDLAHDLRVAYQYNSEGETFRKAQVVYLATVESSRPIGGRDDLKSVVVKPVFAMKAKMPLAPRQLSDIALSSCGYVGDCDAPRASIGELVFVFEGLEKNKYGDRPNGIDSIRALDARNELLMWTLYDYLKIENPNP